MKLPLLSFTAIEEDDLWEERTMLKFTWKSPQSLNVENLRLDVCICVIVSLCYEYYLIFLSFEDNNEDEPIGFNMLLESEAYSPVSFVLLSFVNLRS